MAKAKKVTENVGSSRIKQAIGGVRKLILEPEEVPIAREMGYHHNQQLPEKLAIEVASKIGSQAALQKRAGKASMS